MVHHMLDVVLLRYEILDTSSPKDWMNCYCRSDLALVFPTEIAYLNKLIKFVLDDGDFDLCT